MKATEQQKPGSPSRERASLAGLFVLVALLVAIALLPHWWQRHGTAQTVAAATTLPALPPDHASSLDSTWDMVPDPPSPAVTTAGDTAPVLPPLPEGAEEREIVIGRGQTLYAALRARGVDHTLIMRLVKACRPYRNLTRVHRGDCFRIVVLDDGTLWRLRFDLTDDESYIALQHNGEGGYTVFELTYPVQHEIVGVGGRVGHSLFESLRLQGAPTVLASKLNDILGWDIDFRRDSRPDDTYRIIYEQVRRDGRLIRTGSILAAEYVNRGRIHRAYRYTTRDGKTGYYDPEGRSLAKQLMRAPLEYSRISSPFSLRRYHPILKKWAPHYGIDYAAPVGTPVWAAGDGIIDVARYSKTNGRYLKIRHTNRSYESYYLHLSRYAKGIRKGVRVRQGQVIGYVGATGLATGPHLDFRVRKDGRWVDPRRLDLPAGEPVPAAERARFLATIAPYAYTLAALPDACTPIDLHGGPALLAAPTQTSETAASASLVLLAACLPH